MTLLLDAEPVTEKTIIKAVAAQCFGLLLNLRTHVQGWDDEVAHTRYRQLLVGRKTKGF
jgi:hypothetical protein